MYAYQPRVGESPFPLGGSDLGLHLPPIPGVFPNPETGKHFLGYQEKKCCWGTDLSLHLYPNPRSVRPGAEKFFGGTVPAEVFLALHHWVRVHHSSWGKQGFRPFQWGMDMTSDGEVPPLPRTNRTLQIGDAKNRVRGINSF